MTDGGLDALVFLASVFALGKGTGYLSQASKSRVTVAPILASVDHVHLAQLVSMLERSCLLASKVALR